MRNTEKFGGRSSAGNHLILRRIQLVPNVHADRADRRGITQTKADGMRKIIQVGDRRRLPVEVDVTHIAIHIAAVVENRAAQPVADEWQFHRKTQLLIENQNGQAANRKSAAWITGSGLIEAESTKRLAAASKEPLGELNDVGGKGLSWIANGRRAVYGISQRILHAESGRTGKNEVPAEWMIGRILKDAAYEAAVRAEPFRGQANVHSVESSAPRVAGIIAAIANVGDPNTRNQGWLVVQRNFVLVHTQLRGHDPAKKIPV